MKDFLTLQFCFSGEAPIASGFRAHAFDFDGDGDFDLVDYGTFLGEFLGSQVAEPAAAATLRRLARESISEPPNPTQTRKISSAGRQDRPVVGGFLGDTAGVDGVGRFVGRREGVISFQSRVRKQTGFRGSY